MSIGLVPFTGKALTHKKVCHLLEDGGASDEMKVKMNQVQAKYKELKTVTKSVGIIDIVFDKEIPMYKKSNSLQRTKDEQVKSLVRRKNAFSACALWMTLGFKLMGLQATCQA